MISGTILTTLIYVLRNIDEYKKIGISLNYFLKLFPPYLFGCSLIDLTFAKTNFKNNGGDLKNFNLYDF